MINWKNISDSISVATQTNFSICHASAVSGGYTSQAWHLEGDALAANNKTSVHYFVKLNSADKAAMFEAECAGLTALAATRTVKVPRVIFCGIAGQHALIVLEYFNLFCNGNSAVLGTQLAALHRVHASRFGWQQDNTLALTPQHNTWSPDWLSFWREQRLGFQLDLAARNGYGGRLQELGLQIIDALPDLFAGYYPAPSLLHGDLWGGNYAFLADGMPVIFDPAPYYGDRETDIAMTELFGGFDAEFYAAYHAAYPLDAGYPARKNLYNLYHILNHCNLVGSSYLRQAEELIQILLEKINR
jgi:protein-ribulosamine 3-kinase